VNARFFRSEYSRTDSCDELVWSSRWPAAASTMRRFVEHGGDSQQRGHTVPGWRAGRLGGGVGTLTEFGLSASRFRFERMLAPRAAGFLVATADASGIVAAAARTLGRARAA
jgi:hypothetical protein